MDQLKRGKAAGADGIPPEICKHGGPALHSKLHQLLICCWEQGKLLQDLRDAIIITLYKNKGEKSACSNYRGIDLLSIADVTEWRRFLLALFRSDLVKQIVNDQTSKVQLFTEFITDILYVHDVSSL